VSSTSRSIRIDVQRELDRLTSLDGIERVPGIVLSVFDGEEVRHWASGKDMPWYSAHASLDDLLVGRQIGLFHLVCYVRDGDRVFETYWTTRRGVEAMDSSYGLMDLTVYGRQETWEDSPPGWPQQQQVDGSMLRTNGRPTAQWSRLEAGRSDDLGATAS